MRALEADDLRWVSGGYCTHSYHDHKYTQDEIDDKSSVNDNNKSEWESAKTLHQSWVEYRNSLTYQSPEWYTATESVNAALAVRDYWYGEYLESSLDLARMNDNKCPSE